MKKSKTIKYVLFCSLFLIGIAIGLFIWNKINLPFKNPWRVMGPLTLIKYNPLNDTIRFIVLILFPVTLLMGLYLFNFKIIREIWITKKTSFESSFKSKKTSLIPVNILDGFLILLAVLFVFNLGSIDNSTRKMDTFHEGETLGPSVSLLADTIQYRHI